MVLERGRMGKRQKSQTEASKSGVPSTGDRKRTRVGGRDAPGAVKQCSSVGGTEGSYSSSPCNNHGWLKIKPLLLYSSCILFYCPSTL